MSGCDRTMPLSAGTAFQNGQYVIDAYCHQDTTGHTYLATAIANGQQVIVKALNLEERVADPDQVQQYRQQIQRLADLNHPGIVPSLVSFVEYRQVYLVMAAQIGMPLSQMIRAMGPASPALATQIMTQVVATLEGIGAANWQNLSLDLDQIWWQPKLGSIYLTGFQLFLDKDSQSNISDAHWGPALAGLLYALLVGEPIHQSQAPRVHFRQCRPELDTAYGPMLEQGLNPSTNFSLRQWISLLPLDISSAHDASAGEPVGSQARTITPAEASADLVPEPTTFGSRKLKLSLAFTAVAAGVAGLGFGLTLRLQPGEVVGKSRFDPKQNFPPLDSWPNQTVDWSSVEDAATFEDPYMEPNWSTEERIPPPSVAPTPESQPAAEKIPRVLSPVDTAPPPEETTPARELSPSEPPSFEPPAPVAPVKSPRTVAPQPPANPAPLPVAPAPPEPIAPPPTGSSGTNPAGQPAPKRSMTTSVSDPLAVPEGREEQRRAL